VHQALTERLAVELAHYGKEGLNLQSPQQLQTFLYGDLGLPISKRTKTGGACTDAATLSKLVDSHPAVGMILEFKTLSKIKGTYVDGLSGHVAADGRIHSTINLDGAESGRLSSSDPNLQNIPRSSTREGKLVKDLFAAPSGWTLCSLDYSQIELRVAAILSGDKKMQEIFLSGQDYHMKTAKMISRVAWDIPPEEVTSTERTYAKMVIFGLLFGMTDFGLAHRLSVAAGRKVETEEATKIRKAIFGELTSLKTWIDVQRRQAKKTGYCYTFSRGERARRRPLWNIGDPAGERGRMTSDARTAENGSFNSPIQGTAADCMLGALLDIDEWIQKEGIPAKLTMSVHDSAILEVRDDCVPVVVAHVQKLMSSQGWGGVPLKADAEVGRSWGSMEPVVPAPFAYDGNTTYVVEEVTYETRAELLGEKGWNRDVDLALSWREKP